MNKLVLISSLISLVFLSGLTLSINSSQDTLQNQNGDLNNRKLKIQQYNDYKVITRDIQSPKQDTVYYQDSTSRQNINQVFTAIAHPSIEGAYKFQLDQENTDVKLNLSAPMNDINKVYVLESTQNDLENNYIWWEIEQDGNTYLVRNINQDLDKIYLCGDQMFSQGQVFYTSACNVVPEFWDDK